MSIGCCRGNARASRWPSVAPPRRPRVCIEIQVTQAHVAWSYVGSRSETPVLLRGLRTIGACVRAEATRGHAPVVFAGRAIFKREAMKRASRSGQGRRVRRGRDRRGRLAGPVVRAPLCHPAGHVHTLRLASEVDAASSERHTEWYTDPSVQRCCLESTQLIARTLRLREPRMTSDFVTWRRRYLRVYSEPGYAGVAQVSESRCLRCLRSCIPGTYWMPRAAPSRQRVVSLTVWEVGGATRAEAGLAWLAEG